MIKEILDEIDKQRENMTCDIDKQSNYNFHKKQCYFHAIESILEYKHLYDNDFGEAMPLEIEIEGFTLTIKSNF